MYARFIATCKFHGSSCQKKRSATHTANFGRVEPVAYLTAWDDLGSDISEDTHKSRFFAVPMLRVHEKASV